MLLKRYGLAVGLAVLYLYSFPYFAEIRSANELPRIYLTQAIVDQRTVAIDTGVQRWGSTADVSPSRGHQYSNKAPGSSFLAIPAYLLLEGVKAIGGSKPTLAEMTWTFRVFTGIIPTLLFLLLLWRFLSRFCPDEDPRRIALVGYAIGSMAMTYSVLFISHQLSAVCIGTAYILAVWVIEDGLDERWLIACGFAAGCAPLVDYQAAFAGVPIAAYVTWHLVSARRWRPLAYVVLASIPPVVLLLIYHWQAFGGPFKTGYDASETFSHFHQKGFLGADKLRWEAFTGSTIAPDNGLLFFCPMLLLALPGWVLMARRKLWWHFGLTLSVVTIYLVFITSLIFWRGGWQMGPRYITAMLPFAMVPVAVAIAAANSRWYLRGLVLGGVGVGIVVYALSCAEYPHFPEKFHNPLFEVTLRLIAGGHAPYNLGYLVGLRGFASLVPYLAVLLAVVGHIAMPTRRAWRSAVLAAAVLAATLALYSTIDGGGKRADVAYERFVEGVMPR